VMTISSSFCTWRRPQLCATRLMASVAPRVKTISRADGLTPWDLDAREIVGDSAWDEDPWCKLCLVDYGIDPIFRLWHKPGSGGFRHRLLRRSRCELLDVRLRWSGSLERCLSGHLSGISTAELLVQYRAGRIRPLRQVGSRLGSGCILGEGTLLPPDTVIPAGSVLVGRPPHVIRSATDADRERLAVLRQHQTNLTDYPGTVVSGPMRAGERMGTLYSYRDKTPSIGAGTVLFDSAEVTGDVVIGKDTLIGAGVKIIGDSHGPVRIGSRVQILENTVLHLLPDNELIVDDDAVIGPGAMIHGCHIGRGSIVEPGAIVCDGSVVGAESVVRAGACVKQRDRFGDRSVLDGFPARLVRTLTGPPPTPGWALPPDAVATLRRVQR